MAKVRDLSPRRERKSPNSQFCNQKYMELQVTLKLAPYA